MPLTFPLTIGNITLNQNPFEGPDGSKDGLSDLGSKQKNVVHEFPGGIVTAQLYGSFPKSIEWSGKLFGGNAVSRSFQLQQLCDNGQEITLTWSQWSFDGFVEDYKVIARSFNEIDYKLVFRPVDNNNTANGGNQLASNDPFSGTVSNAQSTAKQQASSPASGGALPSGVQSGVTSLNDAINQALQQSGGSVSAIPKPTLTVLQGQISTVQNLLQPVINGSDPLAASAAADLAGTLGILNTAFNQSINPLLTTITVVNPDLYQLSNKYYGTPTLYWVIQAANEDLIGTDPLPITNGPIQLAIPVKPIITSTSSPTVMSDALANAA